MPSDWDEALKIAGQGFGATIVALVAVCAITWLVGWILQKRAAWKARGGDKEEGDAHQAR